MKAPLEILSPLWLESCRDAERARLIAKHRARRLFIEWGAFGVLALVVLVVWLLKQGGAL